MSRSAHPADRSLQATNTPRPIVRKTSAAGLFSEGRGFMDGFDLTMQLQIGCPGGCEFCYVRTGFRLAPADVQRNWGYEIRDKTDIAKKVRRALDRGELADKTIYCSGVTDPYAASGEMTRDVWTTLLDAAPELRPRRIAIQTRYRPSRDAEIMAEYERSTRPGDGGPAVVVSYSMGTDRQDLIDAWELRTPSFGTRLHVTERLREAGIWVVPTLSPLAPWNDLTGLSRPTRAAGAQSAVVVRQRRIQLGHRRLV